MSIVERALRKSQSARAAAQPESPAAREPPETPAPGPAAERAAVRVHEDGPAAESAPPPGEIVAVNMERLRDLGRMASVTRAQQTDEEIRRIKWPVLNSMRDDAASLRARSNVVLVTSAVPGEGKTFISLNLALSIARDRELSVVLVDGDVAKPGLTPSLGLQDRVGLVDALDDAALSLERIVYGTDVEGLSFVPSGKWHEHSAEFFSSRRMQDIVEWLSRRASPGVVVIDSPPVLATSDAQAGSRYAGQVVLVVRADSTSQQEVTEAVSLLDPNVPVRAVLNCVESSMVSNYYGRYYYGYGHHGKKQSGKP